MSNLLFLEPVLALSYTPNFVDVEAGSIAAFDNDEDDLNTSTTTDTDTVVSGGVAEAIATATANVTSDPGIPTLLALANAAGVGIDGAYEGLSLSSTEAIATLDTSNGQPLAFSFSTVLDLAVKEIENPNAEYNQATATTAFLIFNTSNNSSELLDYLTIQGNLVSSEQAGDIDIDGSNGILNVPDFEETVEINVDGDDGIDSLQAQVSGTYEQTFDSSISEVTVVQVQTLGTIFAGDTLIGNLGPDIQYGTIEDDILNGNEDNNKIYGSLGDDRISGKSGDDILEGGRGDDALYGNGGDDQLHGGDGNDRLKPNKGNDIIAGGVGSDLFIFGPFRPDEIDTILDFEVGLDKIHLPSLGNAAKQKLFDTIQDTAAGAQLTFNSGGRILIAGQTANSLGSAAVLFV